MSPIIYYVLKEKRGSFIAILLIVAAYALIAAAFTYPLITKLTWHGFGIDEDAPYQIWHNWWLKFALLNLKQNPLWTDYIFHPQTIPLIYDANSFVFGALTLPLQFFTSALVASNIVFLLSFVLAGVSMHLLSRYLKASLSVSALMGLVFAFSPYTLAQAMDGHTNLTTTWLIPLYTLSFLKTLDSIFQKEPRRPTVVFSMATGLIAALQLYSDFTYTTFLIIETGLILTYFLAHTLNRQRELLQFSLFGLLKRLVGIGTVISVTAVTLSSPILLEIIKVSKVGPSVGSPLWVQNEWSADLKSYLRPPDRSTFFKTFSYTSPRGAIEGTVFPGYTILLLFLLAISTQILKHNRDLEELGENKSPFTDSRFWIFLSLSFFVFSLGPSLHYNGSFQFNGLGLKNVIFPLPWMLLHKVPLVGEAQEPARLNPFLILSLAVTTGLFLNFLSSKFKSRLRARFLIGLVTLAILVEYLPVPFPTTNLQTPDIYQKIALDQEKFSVLVLPLGFNSGNISLGKSPIGSLQYYQVVHQHPSFRGTVARLPTWAFDYYRKLPLIKFLLDPAASPDSQDQDKELVSDVIKNKLSVKYIVIHKDKYENGNWQKTDDFINDVLDLTKISDEEGVVGYKLR